MTTGGTATQQAVQFAVPHEMRGREPGVPAMRLRAGRALGALVVGPIVTACGSTWPIRNVPLVGVVTKLNV